MSPNDWDAGSGPFADEETAASSYPAHPFDDSVPDVPTEDVLAEVERYEAATAPLCERYARAVLLLQAITAEAESLNAALAADEITQKQARVRVQNIHGLAATPEVEEWEVRRVG